MLNLKKRNKNKRRCLVLALGFVCSIISLSGCSQQETIDVSEHYAKYVFANESAELFSKQDAEYQKIGTIEADVVIELADKSEQDMEVPYFKLLDKDVYVDANKVSPTENTPLLADDIPYLPFNENVNTEETFTLYNEADQPLLHLHLAQSYPVYIKEDDRYGVYIDQHIFYIKAEDVVDVSAAENTVAETAVEVPVLMYHAFYDKADTPEDLNGNYVEKDMFRQHLQYLKDHAFTTLRMIDVERFLDGKVQLPKRSVAITMDDGYENEAVISAPLLQEFGFYGTAFIITNWYDRGLLPAYWLQARDMGLELQSHSHGMHTGGCSEQHGGRLLCEDYDTVLQDIKISMDIVNGNVFCYPFGDYNERAKEILKEAGIHMAFTTQYGTIKPGMDKLELPRIRVHGDAGIDQFAASITY